MPRFVIAPIGTGPQRGQMVADCDDNASSNADDNGILSTFTNQDFIGCQNPSIIQFTQHRGIGLKDGRSLRCPDGALGFREVGFDQTVVPSPAGPFQNVPELPHLGEIAFVKRFDHSHLAIGDDAHSPDHPGEAVSDSCGTLQR
jgi:hypothetical protein